MRGAFFNGICPARVVGADNREPAISMVHILNRSFILISFVLSGFTWASCQGGEGKIGFGLSADWPCGERTSLAG
jgi:hypothetical protein